jgi:stage III sporulation protein AD
MEMMQWAGVALLIGFLVILLKEHKPLFALVLSLAAGVLLLTVLLDKLELVMQMMRRIAERADVQPAFIGTLLKIIGIAYIAEFAAQTLRDAGQESIAAKVELAGKLFILVMALPILQMILDTILKLLER